MPHRIELPDDPTSLPWGRVVHFYGRADDIPRLLALVQQDESDAHANRLAYVLEHQDGVIQATPLAVFYMCKSYAQGTAKNVAALEKSIRAIYKSAKFKLSSPGHVTPELHSRDLFGEDCLWPPFTSDEEDDALWEAWAPSRGECFGWAAQTCRMVEDIAPMLGPP